MSRKKDLYMTKNHTLEELNKAVDEGLKKTKQKKEARIFLTAANRILPEAEKAYTERDEELSYVLYMRYLELVNEIQKAPGYDKDKIYFNKMIGSTKLDDVLVKCEALSGSLKSRYQMIEEAARLEKAEREKEVSEATENENQRLAQKNETNNANTKLTTGMNGIIKPTNTNPEPKVFSGDITTVELKNLIEQKSTKLLILDCRSNSSFLSNHVNHPNCVSIPDDVLVRGFSASKIAEKLKQTYPGSYIMWENRTKCDLIVLYDWNSSFNSMSERLQILYDAITKWDTETYNKTPVILQGGMRNMYYSYPTLLTNPTVNITEENKRMDDNIGNPMKKLDQISYPNFDYDEPKPSRLNSNHTSTIYNNISKDTGHSNNNFSNDSINSIKVDRSNKPQAKHSDEKIPNGTVSKSNITEPYNCNGVGHNEGMKQSGSTDSVDIKVKAEGVHAALDDVIKTSQKTIETEENFAALYLNKDSSNADMVTQMQEKEKELESMRLQLEEKDNNYKKLKEEHDELVKKEQDRLTLPKLRLKPEEKELKVKEDTKAGLDAYVKKLREERKLKEQRSKENRSAPVIMNHSPISNKEGSSKQFVSNPKSTMSSSAGANMLQRPFSQDASPMPSMKLKDDNSESPRSSLLKRSHSHPNLAQQSLNEDDEILESQNILGGTPNINRNLKPVAVRPIASEAYGARRREFQVVSSTEKQKTGLKNLGNTCYMNSVIQCIYHSTQLVSYFMSDDYKTYCRHGRGPTRGEATEEVAAVIREMNMGHRSIALNDLKCVVGKYRPAFSGYDQQDSHEFLTFLLDWMHEELNHVQVKNPLKEQKNDGIPEMEAAKIAFDDYVASNQSKISELFCGQQKSCVKCLNCDKESITFEPFFILSVPIPSSSKKCDIQQCIELYTSAEELSGFNCVHCKTTGKATKKIDLWRLPPYLIIHLQRFYYDGWWKKRLAEVEFPVESLDLTRKVKGRLPGDHRVPSPQFQLYGVSNHYGTMDGGHYTAYCRKGLWYKFDDHSVESINSREVCTAAAYILFYNNLSP